ncbi:MFS transporter [Chitinimonas arctica]|uniref:MFS transporter n=1 Tax=Chitinimonas arctica TaxID=2594795 RepID=A0A516SBE6_9NEIS|nr:MFS transporter [Chitinimonas arctica]QDQ25471.1 MFS transporter [Chitinimonas arctica]
MATDALTPARSRLMRPAFALLWLSETALDIGAALMSFALGVWIFQRTGSAEQFSQAILAAAAPALLMTPLAGVLADRFDRRWVIAGCDLAAAALIVLLATLLFRDSLAVEHLYFFNAAGAIVASVRGPAYRAAVSLIVPKDRLTQASGLIGLTQSLLQIGAPLLAGYVMGAAGLKGVMLIQLILVFAGALAAFGALTRASHAIRGVPVPARLGLVHGTLDSFGSAIRYFRAMPLMLGLAIYTVLQESLLVLTTAMMTPLVLSTHSSDALGLILTCGALGSLAGSALLLLVRVDRRLMVWVLLADALLSLFVLLAGFTTSVPLWCLCAFFALFAGSASGACAGALWMRKTPKARQGSIFALLGALNLLAMCVVMLAGGNLGEHVFEPALAAGGAWADTVGAWVGTGKGRGLGFMFVAGGAGSCLMSLLALLHTRLRRLDELVPDHADDSAPLPLTVQPLAC